MVKILFDVEYESESSYQLLLRFCGLSFKLPDPFDKHRDEQAITKRMAEVKTQVTDLLEAGWEVYAADEVRLEHEAETRRMWLPKGQRTKFYGSHETKPCFSWVSCAVPDAVGACGSGSPRKETAVLVGWKKRSDNHVLVRMKAEAILYASRGVDVGIIAEMVERAERTVQEWLADWQATRMCSVLTGRAGNQDAAELTRTQKEELKAILARPPSRTGIHAEFWDVPAIRDVVKILFDVEHQSDPSYQLLPPLCGPSLEPPGPVRQAPQRESHHPTHDRGENPSQKLVGRRLGGLHGGRGPLGARGLDPPHAAPGKGSAPDRPWTGRGRPSRSPVRSR